MVGWCDIPVEIILMENLKQVVIGYERYFLSVECTEESGRKVVLESMCFPDGDD